ncbi:MAG: hypothetical protein ACRELF_18200 [Gemmataceae bacterium]
MVDIALGLSHAGTPPRRQMQAGVPPHTIPWEREAIEVFAKKHHAASYRHWRREGLTQTDFAFDFETAFEEAVANAVTSHFNLDGMDLRRAWQQGQYSYLDPKGSYTAWEFRQILTRTELHAKTLFWQNGTQLPLSRVLARAGAAP